MIKKTPFRILSSDILIADIITELNGNEELGRLVEAYGLKPGGKKAITQEQFAAMTQAIEGKPIAIFPGGSSANVLTTLSKLMKDDVQVDFIGRVGKGPFSSMINSAMEEAGINRIKPALPEGVSPQAATTFVIKYPDGKRTTATYPGNARKIITGNEITAERIKQTDAILLQGSLWEKFDREFSNRVLEQRWKQGKELWLALPTRAKFGVEEKTMFQAIIPTANVVLANMAELSRIAGLIDEGTDEKDITADQKQEALKKLQQAFQNDFQGKSKLPNMDRQVGFITDAAHGAYVVTKDKIVHVDAIPPEKIENTVGAGDTAFAGFMYGYLKGRSHETSAKIGMALASEKLKLNGARLPDPAATLKETMPHLDHIQRGKSTDRPGKTVQL